MHKIQRAKKVTIPRGETRSLRGQCSSTRAHTQTRIHTYRADGGKRDEMDTLVRFRSGGADCDGADSVTTATTTAAVSV